MKRKAESELARLVAARSAGGYIEPSKLTVDTYLEDWLKSSGRRVSRVTHRPYRPRPGVT